MLILLKGLYRHDQQDMESDHSQQNAEYFFLWYKINRDTNLFERRGHQF